MKLIILFFLSIIWLQVAGQFIISIKPVIYDKDKNNIASADYFGTYGHIETTFRDTVANIRYKLDELHHFVTALNVNGDTLWNVDPFIVARKQCTLEATPMMYDTISKSFVANPNAVARIFHNIDRPDHITEMKFEKNKYGETVLSIKADSRYGGFLDLKAGKFYPIRVGW